MTTFTINGLQVEYFEQNDGKTGYVYIDGTCVLGLNFLHLVIDYLDKVTLDKLSIRVVHDPSASEQNKSAVVLIFNSETQLTILTPKKEPKVYKYI
jgi:hypothetical protein